jgi:hypothetical protein
MYADEWPEVDNLVQSVLNNCLSTRLNRRTPVQVFTGHAETTPLALMLKDNVSVNKALDFIKAQKLMVLCDNTNETSVSDMLCRDNKEVCKHCKKFPVLGTRGDLRRKQSQANLLTMVNLCLILSGAHRGLQTSLATPLDRDLSCVMLNSVG